MEFLDGKDHCLSGFSDFNLSVLANKLANTPQTLNIIICDYQMKNSTPSSMDCNPYLGQQPKNPGLSLIYHSRNKERELSYFIR